MIWSLFQFWSYTSYRHKATPVEQTRQISVMRSMWKVRHSVCALFQWKRHFSCTNSTISNKIDTYRTLPSSGCPCLCSSETVSRNSKCSNKLYICWTNPPNGSLILCSFGPALLWIVGVSSKIDQNLNSVCSLVLLLYGLVLNWLVFWEKIEVLDQLAIISMDTRGRSCMEEATLVSSTFWWYTRKRAHFRFENVEKTTIF